MICIIMYASKCYPQIIVIILQVFLNYMEMKRSDAESVETLD